MRTRFERESSLGSPIYERYRIDELMLTDELGVLVFSISTSIVNFTSLPITVLNFEDPKVKSLRRIKPVAENPLIVLRFIVCGGDGPWRSRVTDLVTPLSVKFPSS